MSKRKKLSIPYKHLQQENKVLGQIITALKSNKNELEKQNEKLQRHIDRISPQQTSVNLENQTLRNIVAELQNKLTSFCTITQDQALQPPQLQTDTNISKPTPTKTDKADLLQFLQNTSNRINRVESCLSTKPIPIENQANKENDIHCLKQEIHKLEMDKVDLLMHNQQCVLQLQDMIHDQQNLQQKLCYLQNENMRLRQQSIESNVSFNKFNPNQNGKEQTNNVNISQSLSKLSFDDLIKEVELMEKKNEYQQDVKGQIFALSEENHKLREELIAKQNENQSLFDKYNVTLKQYEFLCNKYLT